MLGIGIDYAIQMHARVEEEVVIDRAPHPIQETARNLGPALLVVTFDAIFAFAALRFAKVPMLREFGLLLVVGVAAICLNSIIGPLAILGIREYKSPTKGRGLPRGSARPPGRRLGASPPQSRPCSPSRACSSSPAASCVEDKLVLQTDPIQWVNQNSQVIKDLHVLDHEVHSSSELGVYVQSNDVFTDQTVDVRRRLHAEQQLDEVPRRRCSPRRASSSDGERPERRPRGAAPRPHRPRRCKAAYDVAPTDIQLSTVVADRQGA